MTISAVKPCAAIPQVTITGEGNAGPILLSYFYDMELYERNHARFLQVTPVSTCVSKVCHVFPAFLGKRLAMQIVFYDHTKIKWPNTITGGERTLIADYDCGKIF